MSDPKCKCAHRESLHLKHDDPRGRRCTVCDCGDYREDYDPAATSPDSPRLSCDNSANGGDNSGAATTTTATRISSSAANADAGTPTDSPRLTAEEWRLAASDLLAAADDADREADGYVGYVAADSPRITSRRADAVRLRRASVALSGLIEDGALLDWLNQKSATACVSMDSLTPRGLMAGHRWAVQVFGYFPTADESTPQDIRTAIRKHRAECDSEDAARARLTQETP